MRRHAISSKHSPSPFTDSGFRQLVRSSCARLQTELSHLAPFLAEHVCGWMAGLSFTGKAHDYFLHARSFPLLQLPWWAARNLSSETDYGFLADVFYSTINGYYYVRLLDNLMDGHATIELKILPATAFFHTEFQAVYHRHFAAHHEFWDIFRSSWLSGNDAVARELFLDRIGRSEFEQVTVAKLAAATIPLAAVAFRHNAGERWREWREFTHDLAKWSQMEDDLLDWHEDLRQGKTSYFLSEAARHKDFGSVQEWVIAEGFQQGVETLQHELCALRQRARSLRSRDVSQYLDFRQSMLECDKQNIRRAFQLLRDIAGIIKPNRVSDHAISSVSKRRSFYELEGSELRGNRLEGTCGQSNG